MKKYSITLKSVIVALLVGAIIFWTLIGFGLHSLINEPSSLKDCYNQTNFNSKVNNKQLQHFFSEFKDTLGKDIHFTPMAFNACMPWAGPGKYPDLYTFKVSNDEMIVLTNQINQLFVMNDAQSIHYGNCQLAVFNNSTDTNMSYSIGIANTENNKGCINYQDNSADFSSLEIESNNQTGYVGFEFFFD